MDPRGFGRRAILDAVAPLLLEQGTGLTTRQTGPGGGRRRGHALPGLRIQAGVDRRRGADRPGGRTRPRPTRRTPGRTEPHRAGVVRPPDRAAVDPTHPFTADGGLPSRRHRPAPGPSPQAVPSRTAATGWPTPSPSACRSTLANSPSHRRRRAGVLQAMAFALHLPLHRHTRPDRTVRCRRRRPPWNRPRNHMTRLLIRYLRPYVWLLVGVITLQLTQSIASLFLPSLNAQIIDDGVAHGDTAVIWRLGAIMLAVSLIQGRRPDRRHLVRRPHLAPDELRTRRPQRDLLPGPHLLGPREVNKFGAPSLITRNNQRRPAGAAVGADGPRSCWSRHR